MSKTRRQRARRESGVPARAAVEELGAPFRAVPFPVSLHLGGWGVFEIQVCFQASFQICFCLCLTAAAAAEAARLLLHLVSVAAQEYLQIHLQKGLITADVPTILN